MSVPGSVNNPGAVPPKIGFPQAFNNGVPYQHTSQFNQFNNINSQSPPQQVSQNPFPNQQFSNGTPGPANTAYPSNQFVPNNSSVGQFAPAASAFKPYADPQVSKTNNPFPSSQLSSNVSNPPVPPFQPNGSAVRQTSGPVPSPYPSTTAPTPSMNPGPGYNNSSPFPPGGYGAPNPFPPSAPNTNGFSGHPQPPSGFPTQSPAMSSHSSMNNGPLGASSQVSSQPNLQPSYGGVPPAAPSQYGYQQQQQQQPQPHLNTAMQQTQQQFGQMNFGGPQQNTTGSYGGPAPDLVDLLTERNVMADQEDVRITLPTSLANPNARLETSVFRSTLNAVPQTEELLNKSRLPFGLTLQPYRDMKNLNIIQTSVIVRCKYCRTYINPFCYMPDQRHWKCNLCNRLNDLRDDFCWDPLTKSFTDPTNRPEIQHSTVEFIAPSEYMPVRKNLLGNNELRSPQPAVYVFIIDVSAEAIESGYLFTFSEQLEMNLKLLPGTDDLQIAFIAVDSALHFFQFPSNSSRPPKELVVYDVDEPFLPSNSGLLYSLKSRGEVKDNVVNFVRQLPKLFEKSTTSHNCLGSALNVAQELIRDIGGRISVFQATRPNCGPGALASREDPNQRASNDVQNLGPATDFYKRLALECTGQQIAMDLFMFNSQYCDLASLSEISKFTTGCVHTFPNYHCLNDIIQVKKFEKVFQRYLNRRLGLEAVLRIRCSRGLSLSAFYGNFFVRSTDLLALANVNPDSAIAVSVALEEKLGTHVTFQAALLYTSTKGDRRIRVHTLCLPTTSQIKEVYQAFDVKAAVSLLSKIGVERSMSGTPLTDSREAIVNAVVDTMGAFQKTCNLRNNLLAPKEGHLKMYAMYALAMLKHTAFVGNRSVKLDDRIGAMLRLRSAPLEQILSELYPKLYRLNEIEQCTEGNWPSSLPLSFEHVHRDGIYLLEAGIALFLYVPSTADGHAVQELFGCTYNNINEDYLKERDNSLSRKVFALLKEITYTKYQLGPVIVVREDSSLREEFVRRMIEDRTDSSHSYIEFLQHIKREIASS